MYFLNFYLLWKMFKINISPWLTYLYYSVGHKNSKSAMAGTYLHQKIKNISLGPISQVRKICIDQRLRKYYCTFRKIWLNSGAGKQVCLVQKIAVGSGGVVPEKFCNSYPHLNLETVFVALKLTQNSCTNRTFLKNWQFNQKLAPPLLRMPSLKDVPVNLTNY